MYKFKMSLTWAARLLLLLLLTSPVQAQTVTLKLPSLNLTAESDYVVGQKNKPAVLILHGFLTTNKFHTVTAITSALQQEGYTTIAPTLTLDISQRQNSLKCNSIHTHTLEKDILEITDWVHFLHGEGHKNIVLIGHSSGSQELIEFLNIHPEISIEAAIFTSLFYFKGDELGTVEREVSAAKQDLANNQDSPKKYSFLFCKNNYHAVPESFLSYLKLDRAYTLNSLKKLSIPTYTIMGGADKRYQEVGENWLTELRETGTHVYTIKGANHFFSNQYEFDLQDAIIEIISRL